MSIDQQAFAPLISIIMPIYNRASFVKQAIKSINSQTYTNWELIVIDDGSNDDTFSVLEKEALILKNKCKILRQENSGPAKARNKGILNSQGELIAFFDSDDKWNEEHLTLAVEQFSNYSDLEWVFFACKRVNKITDTVLQESTFYTNRNPNGLFTVIDYKIEELNILKNSDAARIQLGEGIDSGLQNSIIKRTIFDKYLLPEFRIGEDMLFILLALKTGFKIGFVDKVTVTYNVHTGNISDTNLTEIDISKRSKSLKQYIDAFESVSKFVSLNEAEIKIHRDRLFTLYVWDLGYSIYSKGGEEKQAFLSYLKGWKFVPFKLSIYKILSKSIIKMILR